MKERYIEASPVERDLLNLINKALSDKDKRNRFINERSFKTMIGRGVTIGSYDSGTLSLTPVDYKGEVCFKVEFSLFDYSLYSSTYPYAKGTSGAYLLDRYANLLAIAEDVTRPDSLDSFPWSMALSKCKDKKLKELIDEPSIFIKTAGDTIPAKKYQAKKPSLAMKYIKKVLGKTDTMSIDTDLDVEASTKTFVSNLYDHNVRRSLDYIDRDIQDNIDTMEDLIDNINGDMAKQL
ncbi:MAG: hypothetical protein IJW28_04285 [Clostridia bacterium]|nr:hypothetical protein [Clostridia bacterium]